MWVIRHDLVEGEVSILPLEIVEETKRRALLVGWCPQEQVLKHPTIEDGDVSREECKQLLDELEQVKKERADEAKELIYLWWTNACLRHGLVRHHEQQQNQYKNHLELEFRRNNVVINYDSEHELHNSLLEHHSDPSFDKHASGHDHSDIACSKRTKLLERLKRWVDGSEKPRVRNFISKGAEEHLAP
ncbi:hypothetical protein JHK82_043462 [Glycine max]|nr:hypothetical protein JHK82_043462 [Glycine max]